MAQTRINTTQARFQSQYTGDHVLDTYIEDVEAVAGGIHLAEMMAELFDIDGTLKAFDFRFNDSGVDYLLEYRIGTEPWQTIVDFATFYTTISTSATNAAASASAASTSATNAANSATNAAASATSASTSASTASTAATAAATSETNAATSETNAASSASAAATSESNAATSASNASTSASSASTSASNASTSASAASTSATNAATSASDAATALDDFTDLYLGAKTSNPTLDNDGDPLQDGAIYFNTNTNQFLAYDLGGTTWYALSSGIVNLVEDTTPQLGGNLDVNGYNITGTGSIDLTGNITLTNTDAGSGTNPLITLFRDSASPAAADDLGGIIFDGRDSLGNQTTYGKIILEIDDPTNGVEDAELQMWVLRAGVLEKAVDIDDLGFTFYQGNDFPRFYSEDGSAAANFDYVYQWDMQGLNSTPAVVTYARLVVSQDDITAGAEDGQFRIYTMQNGTLTQGFRLDEELAAVQNGRWFDVEGSANDVRITGAAAAAAPSIAAVGDDTDISLNLVPKGAGVVQIGGTSIAPAADAVWEAGVSTTQQLTTPAKIAAAIAALASGGGVSGINIQSFTASGTYTPTSGYTRAIAFATGGGGGSGGSDLPSGGGSSAGGGGGGGATAVGVLDLTTITSETVTIGAGGAAGSTTGGNGGSGGQTSLGALLTANGGSGGTGSGLNPTGGNSNCNGGAGSSTTGGTALLLTLRGSSGDDADGLGGGGGSSFWGGGAGLQYLKVDTDNPAAAGEAYGSGAAGGTTSQAGSSSVAGAAGAAGVVIIFEFK